MTIIRRSAHYRLSLAGGGTDLPEFEGEGLCITLSLPWVCTVVRTEVWGQRYTTVLDVDADPEPDGIGEHPILKHLPHIQDRQWHYHVTHELPTRVGLGSSAALALAATGDCSVAQTIDKAATGAGWQDVAACFMKGLVVLQSPRNMPEPLTRQVLDGYPEDMWWRHLLLFSVGGTHTTPMQPKPDPYVLRTAKAEAEHLRSSPTLETLADIMTGQAERKRPLPAIEAARESDGFMSAKPLGSRGAGFGVVLTKNREAAKSALIESGARVWLP